MTLNKAYSRPSFLSVIPPLFLCSSQPYPPPERARLPGHGAVGLAGSTLRLITPLISGLPVCLQGQTAAWIQPPASSASDSHPFTDAVPSLSPFLHPFRPSVPVLPEALRDNTKSQPQTGPLSCSPCLVHHMSWQMGLLWTLAWIQEK